MKIILNKIVGLILIVLFSYILLEGMINNSNVRGLSFINNIERYDIEYVYNNKIPTGIINVLQYGKNQFSYYDDVKQEYRILQEKKNQIIEIGTGEQGNFYGIVTGYGPDCATCDGRGYVACQDPNGKWISLISDGNFYFDSRYGNLQIVAADWRIFPCGTIIEINNDDLDESILGIVMDTGSALKNAYDNGRIHIDIAFKSEKGLKFKTNTNTNFDVKRWGW